MDKINSPIKKSRAECFLALEAILDCSALYMKEKIVRPPKWKFWHRHASQYADQLKKERLELAVKTHQNLERFRQIKDK